MRSTILHSILRSLVATILLTAVAVPALPAHAQLSPQTEQQIAAKAEQILHATGVPSASLGVVENGRIVYTHAFGLARVNPPLPATTSMAYPIGSISKQFTAAAMLILEQQGKLSLNDPVAKYFPHLTRAHEVRILNLLTHTSGYQDYAPQDYTIPAWKLPTDPLRIVREYAGKPLDFTPGTQWQYSNTNFVLAALIIQKVSGVPFAKFLRDHVLAPAHIEHVLNLNTQRSQLQVTGYMRYALAPVRPAALEAPGWYFGDADLAMPVASLLTWDLTLINQSLLTPAGYNQMETPFFLQNGTNTHYGLGMNILERNGHRMFEHSGEVGGFVAENMVFPADRAAIAVLTNQEASNAATEIAEAIVPLILTSKAEASSTNPDTFAPQLETILTGLAQGHIDRALFTADCNAYFDRAALADFQSSLSPLGSITSVTRTDTELRGGMTFSEYRVSYSVGTTIVVTVYLTPNGKIEQLLVPGNA